MERITGYAVLLAAAALVEDWSKGDLDKVCGKYAVDASFVSASKKTVVRGRQSIAGIFRESFSNDVDMGSLSLQLVEFRASGDGSMASAIFKWTLSGDSEHPEDSGLSLVTYKLVEGEVCITQDASV